MNLDEIEDKLSVTVMSYMPTADVRRVQAAVGAAKAAMKRVDAYSLKDNEPLLHRDVEALSAAVRLL